MKQETCVRAQGFEGGYTAGGRSSSGGEGHHTNSDLTGWGNYPNTGGFQAEKNKIK